MSESYKDMTDNELTKKVQFGHFEAFSELAARYSWLIDLSANRFRSLGDAGLEDLKQEGLLGLYAACCAYKAGLSNFGSYAGTCIRNRIISAVRREYSKKNMPMNKYSPLEEDVETAAGMDADPQHLVEAREAANRFSDRVSALLSPLEYRIFLTRLNHIERTKAPKLLGLSQKAYDNGLGRVRKKLERLVITG